MVYAKGRKKSGLFGLEEILIGSLMNLFMYTQQL
jgi:hypothetical protein